jgi:ATP-dependent DNA helicase RecQ
MKETPVIAKQMDPGKIKVVHYYGGNLITPLICDLTGADLKGSTCVLTKTNEEAMQITGLLLKNNIPARLIQSNDSFSLYNMLEVRFFLESLNLDEVTYIIPDQDWENAKRVLVKQYHTSAKLEICKNIIRDFEATNPKRKYKTDLEIFIRESRLEDFYNENGETIFVSTIHKAKGKEFDEVFLMLENFDDSTDAAKRQLYVAMTRAKQSLRIHSNGHFLDTLTANNLERINDREGYLPPSELTMQLNYKDIWLDFFINRQHLVAQLMSGERLTVRSGECLNSSGQCVLKFSQKFMKQIEALKEKNYVLESARVNFIVYWLKEGTEHEVKIVLPELEFVKVKA